MPYRNESQLSTKAAQSGHSKACCRVNCLCKLQTANPTCLSTAVHSNRLVETVQVHSLGQVAVLTCQCRRRCQAASPAAPQAIKPPAVVIHLGIVEEAKDGRHEALAASAIQDRGLEAAGATGRR